MEPQLLLNIAFGLAGFFGGWIINSMSKSILKIEDKIADLPLVYVAKEDYRGDIQEIKNMLGKIFDRLDTKVDK